MKKKEEDKEGRSKPRRRKYTSLKQAVEPRYLYDASLVAPPHDPGIPVDAPSTQATHTEAPDAGHVEMENAQPIQKTPNDAAKDPVKDTSKEIAKDSTLSTDGVKDSKVDKTLAMNEFN
jgi:hypothetical protein